ncbi:MAG: hypothetical protein ACXAEU_08645 [Candidatus Hodarchaeales archaeon]
MSPASWTLGVGLARVTDFRLDKQQESSITINNSSRESVFEVVIKKVLVLFSRILKSTINQITVNLYIQ